jgi:L-galactose dehydrogenase
MDMVRLGRTGLNVSVACLGTGGHSLLGQAYGKSFEHSVNVLKAAFDLGVNFIDTAVGYGNTEEIVGAAIRGRRDKVVISTKEYLCKAGTPIEGKDYWTPVQFSDRIEGNLRRLGTDYIDVYYIHGVLSYQYDYCINEILPVLRKAQEEGKIGYLGLSGRFLLELKQQMFERGVDEDLFDVMMIGHNFVNQCAERYVLPEAKKKDVAVQSIYAVRSKLTNFETANKLVAQVIAKGEVDAADLDLENPLGFLLTEGGASSLTNACYRYNRYVPGVSVVVMGTGNIEHLKENVRSINDKPLPEPVIARLKKIFHRVESVTAD